MSDELGQVLAEIDGGMAVPFYLLWGEEFLVRKGADELVRHLLPRSALALSYSTRDGASPAELAQDLATLPLLRGRKVVFTTDPEFLAPKKGRGDPLGKAREAWKSGRRKEGARRVLGLVAKAGWTKAPSPAQWKEELGVDLSDADLSLLREVIAFCEEEKITAPGSDVSPLVDLLEKGLPDTQILVIAATEVDPKNALVKIASERGRLIERKVATRLKELDVSEAVQEVLAPFKKRLSNDAEALLKDRCGANMRALQMELEKLALHAEGPVIEAADVEQLVGRSREEEFLELSNALQQRDLEAALAYVADAMQQGVHPLQVLGAVASILRTLLLNHDRLVRLARGRAPRYFDDFKSRVFPAIVKEITADGQRSPHPYAAFVGIQAASRYERGELLGALASCAEADVALKSSGNGRLVLERLLWSVCRRVAA
ncbi:MAG TPA: DNA polymerase III subunit delta [Myxococcaceae bacterium]|nr:DNA polymerase III subunit delta [Myxococcaceae bacterium]